MGLFKKDTQLEETKRQLKEINPAFKAFGIKQALKALPTYLDSDEEIKFATTGSLGSGLALTIITNKKFLALRKDSTTMGQSIIIPLKKINDISYKSGITSLSKLFIADGSQKYKITDITVADVETLIHTIKHEMQIENDAQINSVNNSIDAADEIVKFKKLADDGIITQEEFEAKKKQLLGL
ncbi:PH domain-containing protein [Limosilactobacillus sp. pH52_RY]|uniref:PH domain-containing protein n=1 Tax=Limosilactobacillus balticus TaxID=2759747 RepID=UPI0015FE4906|nr:PH domain-containing protein [Limosilactobacillus balticus]MBB1110833.1 PH domain-containing protein [Limosilactobacillus balticus]